MGLLHDNGTDRAQNGPARRLRGIVGHLAGDELEQRAGGLEFAHCKDFTADLDDQPLREAHAPFKFSSYIGLILLIRPSCGKMRMFRP